MPHSRSTLKCRGIREGKQSIKVEQFIVIMNKCGKGWLLMGEYLMHLCGLGSSWMLCLPVIAFKCDGWVGCRLFCCELLHSAYLGTWGTDRCIRDAFILSYIIRQCSFHWFFHVLLHLETSEKPGNFILHDWNQCFLFSEGCFVFSRRSWLWRLRGGVLPGFQGVKTSKPRISLAFGTWSHNVL